MIGVETSEEKAVVLDVATFDLFDWKFAEIVECR